MKKVLISLFASILLIFSFAFAACGNEESLPTDLFFVKGNSYEFRSYDHSQLATSDERMNEIMLEMGFRSEEEYNGWVIEINNEYKDYAVDFKQDGTFYLFKKNSGEAALTGTYNQDKYVINCSANGQDITFRIWNSHVALVLREFYSSEGYLEFICLAIFI